MQTKIETLLSRMRSLMVGMYKKIDSEHSERGDIFLVQLINSFCADLERIKNEEDDIRKEYGELKEQYSALEKEHEILKSALKSFNNKKKM